MTREQLNDLDAILSHVLHDTPLLVQTAATRRMTIFEAYTAIVDERADIAERLRLLDKQEGVKASE